MWQIQNHLFTYFFVCSFIFLLIGIKVVECGAHQHDDHDPTVKKLFVFGDSYADTGNTRIAIGQAWKQPYGFSFPGKPSGRFSDGRVLTDFLARSLGTRTPLAYKFRKFARQNLKYGMNFAYGGTGVFDTKAPYPNITTQIDLFQTLLHENAFDLQNSIAHFSLVGNDYSFYLAKGGSAQGLQTFIPKVVNELVVDIVRVYNLGVKKISVTSLQPLGCVPSIVHFPFQQCNDTYNQAVAFHNLLLQQAISKFNNQTNSSIVLIDLYNSFFSVFRDKGSQSGNIKFENPLEPCCTGINQTYNCGSVDEMGNKMYKVCQHPNSYFFWDEVHPTQAGWKAVISNLKDNLQQLQFN
ncbi:unnamed protein product [Amaranthus hypochondriacus]